MSPRLLNLATEPVERVQKARRIVVVAAAAVLTITLLHAGLVVWLKVTAAADPGGAGGALDAATLEDWQREVAGIAEVAGLDRARGIINSVQVGNQLIAWRTIPWAAIFTDLEEVLPDGARLESVQPGLDATDQVRISMLAVAGDTGPLQDLLIRLEGHPRFAEVLPQREESGEDGLARLLLVVRYLPAADEPDGGAP